MKKLFGTDGIRGVAGAFPLDPSTIGYIGMALREELMRSGSSHRLVIGRDTRESGQWITEILVRCLLGTGVGAIEDVGVITTPGLAFLTRAHGFDLGVMISASHNPFEDNGIKVFSSDGFKLSDARESQLEKRIDSLIESGEPLPSRARQQVLSDGKTLIDNYCAFLKGHFKGDLRRYQVGLDVCNGSAFSIAPNIFKSLGASLAIINDTPDGRNINRDCGSLHVQSLVELVTSGGLDLGIAFDGDADRSIFVDSCGRIFDGDYVLHAFSRYLKRERTLKSGKVVGTVMTNLALEKALAREGLTLVRAPVGDKYVLETMQRTGANLGGEPSGHVILRDYHTTGDGILTALKLCEMMSREHVSLRQLAEAYHPFPQVLVGLRVQKKIPISDVAGAVEAIRNAEQELGNSGRLVVRYSGTEPILRIMAEGEDSAAIQALTTRLHDELERVFSSSTR